MALEKKILISVDGSASSDKAVDYVGLMEGSVIKDLAVTLLYVMKPIPPFLRRSAQKDGTALKQLKALENKNWDEAQTALNRASERLTGRGFSASALEKKAMPRSADVARDIIFQAEHGMYDAVVLGRRGISKTQELFVGSVTNKVVQHADRLPIWIVGGRVSSLKMLCAVDGSEGSLKAVDHMAFLLGHNPEVEVTLFHVGASMANYCPLDFSEELKEEIEGDLMTTDQECMDDFYSRAVKVLTDSGLDPAQIKTREKEAKLGVAGAIQDEVKRGDYGTVVLGRRGENRSFFLGHVSDKVVARCTEAAVWIVG